MFLRGSIVFSLTSVASVKGPYPHCGQVKCIPLCTRHKVATLVFNGRILKGRLLHFEVMRARTVRRWNTSRYITTQLNTTLSKYSLFIHVGVIATVHLSILYSRSLKVKTQLYYITHTHTHTHTHIYIYIYLRRWQQLTATCFGL